MPPRVFGPLGPKTLRGQQYLYILSYSSITWGVLRCLLGFLALWGQKPCGGNKYALTIVINLKPSSHHLPRLISLAICRWCDICIFNVRNKDVVVVVGKTKRRLHDRKTEHFKALAKNDNTSAIADHVKATGPNIKWYHFDILVKGKTDYLFKNLSQLSTSTPEVKS